MRTMLRMSLVLLVACGAAETSRPGRATADDTPPIADAPHAEDASPTTGPMATIVEAHNRRRARHGAPPLVWSAAIAAQAQSWADHLAGSGCQLEHSRGAYGENLAAGTTGTLSAEDVVQLWYRESARYRYPDGGFSTSTGHFTQLVWASSQRVGCGVVTCSGLDVWVCNYDPPGNVEGQYRENVLPASR